MASVKGREIVTVTESFRQFNPEDLPNNFTFICASPRGSGKSYAMKHILGKIKKRFNHAYVFSETASVQEDAYDFVPKENLFDSYDENAMRKIFDKQKEIGARNFGLKEKDKIKNDILIVLDDVITSKEFQNSKVAKEVFVQGRHVHISIIVLLQNLSSKDGAAVLLRKNADAFMSFSVYDFSTREMIAEVFGSIISKKDGLALISKITEERDYQAIVFLLRDQKGKKMIKTYSDYVYTYVAPATPAADFFIGSKKQRKESSMNVAALNGTLFQFAPSGRQVVEFSAPVISGVNPNRIRL